MRDMQDTELFLSLAEIAGVFVGFGALIAIRSGGATDAWGVAGIGLVVWGGIQAVALALAPVAISRFEVPDHALWVSCSLLFLALFWVVGELVDRAFPERMAMRMAWPLKARWRLELVFALLVTIPMHLALVLILLGVSPDLEAALYFAALVLLLVMVMFELLWLVVTGGRPQPAGETTVEGGPGEVAAP
jgi:hypothetical protein